MAAWHVVLPYGCQRAQDVVTLVLWCLLCQKMVMKLKTTPYGAECTCSNLDRSYCLYFLQIFSFEYLLLFNIINTRHIKFGFINIRQYIRAKIHRIIWFNCRRKMSMNILVKVDSMINEW